MLRTDIGLKRMEEFFFHFYFEEKKRGKYVKKKIGHISFEYGIPNQTSGVEGNAHSATSIYSLEDTDEDIPKLYGGVREQHIFAMPMSLKRRNIIHHP